VPDLDLDRLANARDLAGTITAAGPIPPGRLYRAAALHRAREEDQRRLRALGLRTAMDLRTHRERTQDGVIPAGLAERELHLPLLDETWVVPDLGPDAGPDFLTGSYVDMLDSGAEAIRAAVETLGDPDAYPAVLFCAAGKDRTGTLTAIVLAAAGVDDDAIVADYTLSAERLAIARARMPELRREEMAALPPVLLTTPPEAMHGFLAGLRERHGSVEGYLASLGLGPDHVAALRAALVAA
jgi:protein-tyrosine phosphatase